MSLVPVRGAATSGAGEDVTKPYQHSQRHPAARPVRGPGPLTAASNTVHGSSAHKPPLTRRCSEDLKLPGDEVAGKNRACYNVEFTFDADTQVAITIYYQAIEEFHSGVPV